MSLNTVTLREAGTLVARIRADLNLTQSQLAEKAGVDQSRISRIEKTEIAPEQDVRTLLNALSAAGSQEAKDYLQFMTTNWTKVEAPHFLNPQLNALQLANETLSDIDEFLASGERPWPLVKQVNQQRDNIERAVRYLQDLKHHVAFIGDIGVGKSTAISFLFDLRTPTSAQIGPLDRVILETGGGRTTLCEVQVRRGPGYGISVQPHSEGAISAFVADFSARFYRQQQEDDEHDLRTISTELERAIRNMAKLTTHREKMPDGKRIVIDPAAELVKKCGSEEEFRTKVLEAMNLERRIVRETWFEPAPGNSPLVWLSEVFKKVNNGKVEDMSLPQSIDLVLPNFCAEYSPLEISIIDTKGVDGIAIRPDLDFRLRNERTLTVLCSSFNDAPGQTPNTLITHLRESVDARSGPNRRVAILALPRSDEAMKVKDDSGGLPENHAEGYEFKLEAIARSTGGAIGGPNGTPVRFFNAASDDPALMRRQIADLIQQMRQRYADSILSLCATSNDLIKNHEAQAIAAAVEEVARQLRNFLKGNSQLGPQSSANEEVSLQLRLMRYAATIWASTRRNGDWQNFDVYHFLSVGASKIAIGRSREWMSKLQGKVAELRADPDLKMASRVLEQIKENADGWRKNFSDSVAIAALETYRTPLQTAGEMWAASAGEWGRGPGFKGRVATHINGWFAKHGNLEEILEQVIQSLWESNVLRPLRELSDDSKAKS